MNIPKEFGERFIVGDILVKRPSCVVYRGKDRTLGDREVAIKVYVDQPNDNKSWIERFKEEANKLRAASHASLVPILHGDFEEGWFYLVMELIEGESLRERIEAKSGPVGVEAALAIVSELAAGVHEIHENGTIHGHIDSRAVLFKGDLVRLAGYYPLVISEIQKGLSTAGRLIVEPAYVAPEQISGGTLDGRVDIFALSVLLFEMITGQRPFQADNPLQMAMLRLSKEPPSPAKLNSAVSPLLDAAIMKGLARDPNERYGNVKAFAEAITGGRGEPTNPLADAGGGAIGDQTIGVSMSTESIREMLRSQDESKKSEPAQASEDTTATQTGGVAETLIGKPAYADGSLGSSDQASQSKMFGGSFIVLNGELRGQKFWLGKQNTIIGGDSGCDIILSGKGVPSRYAIVIERDEKYYIGPLSSSGLEINDETYKGSDDRVLTRGDVINVGPHQLRFIEPREVFTLQEDVADRVVDRSESNIPKVLAAVVGVIVVVAVVMFTMFESTQEEKRGKADKRAQGQAAERKELIAKLRKEGDEFLKQGALVEPVGANARKRFKQILEINPDHAYAKQRLIEIDERVRVMAVRKKEREKLAQRVESLLLSGDRYFQAGKYISPPGSNAKESYQEVLRVDPNNEKARERLKEIDTILRDLVGRINTLLAKAKEHRAEGRFVSPPGNNAYELLSKIMEVDRGNATAKDMIYDMAAESVVAGDQAKKAGKLREMRKAYLTAQALGVDPKYIKPRIQGTDLIRKSRSSMIFIDRKKSETKDSGGGKYLDTNELERRVAEYQLQRSITESPEGQKFIEVDSLTQ